MAGPIGSRITSREEDLEKVWRKVDKAGPDDCWPWKGYVQSGGKPQILTWPYRTKLTHRVLWEETFGPIPGSDIVVRNCGNDLCCNPAHFELITRAQHNAITNRVIGRSGSDHPRAKLSEDDVKEIRNYRQSGISARLISSLLGISESHVWAIGAGLSRREVACEG